MHVELRALELSDANKLYEFFQKLPASENGKHNRANGLSRKEFTQWVQKEIDYSQGKNLREGYVSSTTPFQIKKYHKKQKIIDNLIY